MIMFMPKDPPSELRVEIFRSGKTVHEIARAIDAHDSQVSRWVAGKLPCPPARQEAIAEFLQRDRADLFPEERAAA